MTKSRSLIILSFLFLGLNLQAQSLKPGLWRATVNFELSGIPMPESKEENCVLPEDLKDIKATISENLKKNGCRLTNWNVKKNKLEASLVCKNNELDAFGTLKGQFSEKSYSLNGEASGTYSMLPTTATIALKGVWVRTCKK